MLHWTPNRSAILTPVAALVRDTTTAQTTRSSTTRADHARMLGHAAARRRRATGEDRGYWLACAPAAVAKAASIRAAGFPRLP